MQLYWLLNHCKKPLLNRRVNRYSNNQVGTVKIYRDNNRPTEQTETETIYENVLTMKACIRTLKLYAV